MILSEPAFAVAAAVGIGSLLLMLLRPRWHRPLVEGRERSALVSDDARIAVARVADYRVGVDSDGDRSGTASIRLVTADGAEHRMQVTANRRRDQLLSGLVDGALFPALHAPKGDRIMWFALEPDPLSNPGLASQFSAAGQAPLGLVLESQRLESQAILDEWRLREGLLSDHDRHVLDNGMPTTGYLVDALDTGLRRGDASLHALTVEHFLLDGEVAKRTTTAFLDDAAQTRMRIDDPIELHYDLDGPGLVVRPDAKARTA